MRHARKEITIQMLDEDYIMKNPRKMTWILVPAIWAFASWSAAVAQDSVVLRGAAIETAGKTGRLEAGQILIENGIIREVGQSVSVPAGAKIIDLNGRTIMPGMVDPYFVVNINLGPEPEQEERVVNVGGRTITIPAGRGRRSPVTFVRVADVFDSRAGEWEIALRSGITTANIVTTGYGQSVVGSPLPKELFGKLTYPRINRSERPQADSKQNGEKAADEPADEPNSIVWKSDGMLYTTLTNDTTSLNTIRNGLRDPQAERPSSRGGDEQSSGSSRGGFGRGRGRGPGGGPPGGQGGGPQSGQSTGAAGNESSGRGSAPADPSVELWKNVRAGQQPLVVNSNNSAALLYLLREHEKAATAKLAVVANGSDWFQVIDELKKHELTAVLPPRWDNHPISRDWLNIPRLLEDKGVPFVFSLSAGQSDYRSMQHNPLFPVSMLVKAGLARQHAIEALTIQPARLLGLDSEIGSIEVGKRADFVVFDADPLDVGAAVSQVWIAGHNVYNAAID